MDNRIKPGDTVKVWVPNNERFGSRDIRNFNEQIFTVSRTVGAGKAKREPTYELEGVTSSYGIPYEFVKDWLMPVGDIYEE